MSSTEYISVPDEDASNCNFRDPNSNILKLLDVSLTGFILICNVLEVSALLKLLHIKLNLSPDIPVGIFKANDDFS